ncbi:MAG: DUF3386 domain-containing protein [Spirulinaceae cyanobacterium]
MTQTLTAKELFRAAYDNRYTWNADFPGYTADVSFKTGTENHTGQVRINSDLTFEVLNVSDDQAKRAINNQLWEMTIHRVSHSFEKTHGENTFTIGEVDDTGATEILLGGANEGNRYKVRDNTVSFVHRHIGNKLVNIHTSSSLTTEEGYLAEEYTSVYLDTQTGEPQGKKTTFKDTFTKIGDYYILTNRLISTEEDGKSATTEFGFSNVQFLAPVTA